MPGVIRSAVKDDDDEDGDRESGSARRRKKSSGKGKGAGLGARGNVVAAAKGGKNKKGGGGARGDRSSTASLMQDAAQVPDLTMVYVVCGVISFLLFGLFFWLYRTFIVAA